MTDKKTEALKLALEALEKLWNIIDDIDTYGDMAKADEKLYRSLVERRQRTRFEETGISTDGYTLNGGAVTAIKEALAEQPERESAYQRGYMDGIAKGLRMEQPAQQQEQKLEFVSPGGGYVPAIPKPIPLDWKLVPRKATPEMLKAMDECAQEGYDERLYAGMASSVYMAAWDASPVMGTLPEQPAQQQEPSEYVQKVIDALYENSDPVSVEAAELLEQMTQQQEPVAYVYEREIDGFGMRKDVKFLRPVEVGTDLYTSPPPRKPWAGLTQQDINIAFDDTQEGGGFDEFARAIEAKLREKNTPQQSKGGA